MEKWKEFFDLLMGGDYFILFIIVLMLIIFALIIYLIKLQVVDKKEQFDEMEEFLEKKKLEQKEIVNVPLENNVATVAVKTETQPDNIVKEDNINDYELMQEEEAIISAQELENKLSSMKENGVPEVDINNYEEEQERKAIISYEELLNRASNTTLNYHDEKIDGLKVSKVEVEDPNIPKKNQPYQYEEEFLRALKEFRASL